MKNASATELDDKEVVTPVMHHRVTEERGDGVAWGADRSLAVEWAHYNIRVNAIAPGYMETEMARAQRGEEPEKAIHL